MANTLGQKFDKATGKNDGCKEAARQALFLLAHRFMTFADVPNNDFNPQFKASKDEARLPDATCPNKNYDRDRHNDALMNSLDGMKSIRFLSLDRDGTTHDFPLRLEFKQVLQLDFSGIRKVERPVLVVAGLDGKEHSFTSNARWNGLIFKGMKNHDRAAAFIAGELKKKAVAARKAAPQPKQACCG